MASDKAKNPGRPYFCCTVGAPNHSCDFFLWADQQQVGESTVRREKRGLTVESGRGGKANKKSKKSPSFIEQIYTIDSEEETDCE